jgi:hypothetical protein
MTGSAPNRVFRIEWSNIKPNGASDGTASFPNRNRTDFQIILYETTNIIEFAYNIFPYPYSTGYNYGFQVGLRANTNTNTHVRVVPSAGGGTAWANSTLGTATDLAFVNSTAGTYSQTNARYRFTPIGATVTCTWNGSTSNDWHTASNWTPAIVPNVCNSACCWRRCLSSNRFKYQ